MRSYEISLGESEMRKVRYKPGDIQVYKILHEQDHSGNTKSDLPRSKGTYRVTFKAI